MTTSSLSSVFKIHQAVLENKLKMGIFTDDDAQRAMTIAHLSLQLRWTQILSAIKGVFDYNETRFGFRIRFRKPTACNQTLKPKLDL